MQSSSVTDKVSRERWQKAQQWEEKHWVNTQRLRARFGKNIAWRIMSKVGMVSQYRGDDWNAWWKKQFDDYRFLPPQVENASRCMENLVKIVRPGGILIVGQDLTDEGDLKVLRDDPGATGHPIKLNGEWFDPFLKGFQPIIKKVLSRQEGREPHQHCGAL